MTFSAPSVDDQVHFYSQVRTDHVARVPVSGALGRLFQERCPLNAKAGWQVTNVALLLRMWKGQSWPSPSKKCVALHNQDRPTDTFSSRYANVFPKSIHNKTQPLLAVP
jgi:hypothetical protein